MAGLLKVIQACTRGDDVTAPVEQHPKYREFEPEKRTDIRAELPPTRCSQPGRRAAPQGLGPSSTNLVQVCDGRRLEGRATCRVLIANRQPIVRHGVRAVIAAEPDFRVIGETDDGGEAVRLARQLRPDVVLIDLAIPTVDGLSATRMIRAELRD